VYEVRIHGRGGQGVVTAAELLSVAAFLAGQQAQAFPSFGSERMGAPVMAFCRIDDVPIRLREPVLTPDAVVVVDATLLHQMDVLSGLSDRGVVLVNSARTARELGLVDMVARQGEGRVVTIDATELARYHLGRPLPNICLLGAFCALTGRVQMGSLEAAVRQRFPGAVGDQNVRAAHAAYDALKESVHA
jgi:pyruvate ferredoxin oxidoreductase gamma subunit